MALISQFRLAGGRFYQNVRRLLKFWRINRLPSESEQLDNVVRFKSVLTLDAPDKEIESLIALQPSDDDEEYYQMAVHHFGLLGTFGALPLRYTEWLIDRHYRYGDEAAHAFIDIFTHRLLFLRFQAWQKYHLYADTELKGYRALPKIIQALAGQFGNALELQKNPASVGLLATSTRALVNLQHLILVEFEAQAKVYPFQGVWRQMQDEYRCCLGRSRLGDAPMLGQAYWDIQSGFHVQLKPLLASCWQEFMPGGEKYLRLIQRIKQFSGPLLSFSLELLVHHRANSTVVLNGSCRLGWGDNLGEAKAGGIQHVYLAECG